jgi:hypothetical protein
MTTTMTKNEDILSMVRHYYRESLESAPMSLKEGKNTKANKLAQCSPKWEHELIILEQY